MPDYRFVPNLFDFPSPARVESKAEERFERGLAKFLDKYYPKPAAQKV